MRSAVLWVVLALGVGGLVGCKALSRAQQERMAKLMEANRGLIQEMDGTYAKLKDGSATVEEVIAAVSRIKAQIETNLKEIEAIKDEGASTWAIIGGVVGALFRTVLHGAAKLPIGGPVGMGLQWLVALLLGGSTTGKKEQPKVVEA